MKGFVDDKLRALLRVPVSASRQGNRTDIVVRIDTAFNGGLAISRKRIAELELRQESSAEAVLADGQSIEMETFACFLDWFGNSYETQIIANNGEFPLLGTMLLDANHSPNHHSEWKWQVVRARSLEKTPFLRFPAVLSPYSRN